MTTEENQVNRKQQQAGRTWLEFILLLCTLGLLVVVAVPKFYDYEADANVTALKGLKSAIDNVMVQTYEQAQASNIADQPRGTLTVEGATIDVQFGYPVASDLPQLIGVLKEEERWLPKPHDSQAGVDYVWVYHDNPAPSCYLSYYEATPTQHAKTELVIRPSCQEAPMSQ
ncbi:hypothetical protein [Salinivibrio sp. IB574]|uniref:hypothetical protein n=1 Tax=Salinivibrio sp. IB574 TaxID=1909444 RepID=UPI0009893C1B|nr:hypothetical protein [Salinivibrio sp. IB574]